MPIYKVSIKGSKDVRVVRAASAAQARNHVASAEAVTSDQLADLLDGGAVIERATEQPEPSGKN